MGLNSIRGCIGQPRALQVFLAEILQQARFSPSNQTISPPKKKKEDITSAQQMKKIVEITPHCASAHKVPKEYSAAPKQKRSPPPRFKANT